MKKLSSDLFKRFENNEVKNLAACFGGTVYITCGLVSSNCEDEAGSLVEGKYDDLYDSDIDCELVKGGGGTPIIKPVATR